MKKNKLSKNRILTLILSIALAFMFVITLVGLIVFSMQIEQSRAVAAERPKEYQNWYVLITEDPNNVFWDSVFQSMCEEGNSNDAYVEKLGDNLSEDYSVLELMEIAIASDVDGIILEAEDTDEINTMIRKASAAGIPVVTVLQDTSSRHRKSFVGPSNYNLGREYANVILRAAKNARRKEVLETGGSVTSNIDVRILLDANSVGTSQNIILTSMQEALDSNKQLSMNIKTTTQMIETENIFGSEESIRQLLQGRDEPVPDVIVCLSEINTKNILQALVDQNKVGEVTVIGYYDSDSILKAIDKGIIYASAAVDTKQMGINCISALNEFKEMGYVNEYYSVDFTMIDQTNITRIMRGHEETNEAD